MNEIFNLLITGQPSRRDTAELVEKLIDISPFELERDASQLNAKERLRGSIAIANRVRSICTLTDLEIGGLLKMFQVMAPEEAAAEQFANMERETGIKRSQAYRFIAAFEKFGVLLLRDTETAGRCTTEALKILSSPSVNDETREKAIAWVREGNYLTIKDAKRFKASQPEPASTGKRQVSPQTKAESSKTPLYKTEVSKRVVNSGVLWQHIEHKLAVHIRPTDDTATVGCQDIVLALEAALAKANQEYIASETSPTAQSA